MNNPNAISTRRQPRAFLAVAQTLGTNKDFEIWQKQI